MQLINRQLFAFILFISTLISVVYACFFLEKEEAVFLFFNFIEKNFILKNPLRIYCGADFINAVSM